MEYSEYQNDFEELEKIYESPNKMTVLYKVKEKESKKIFVIKIIKNIEDSFAKVVFRRECDSLKKLNGHKNIVKIYLIAVGVFSIYFFNTYFSKISNIPKYNPQIIKFQLAPCHKPVRAQTIKIFLNWCFLLPPSGI